ncbi:hypothetical protein KGF54_003091 [Candida jiufengensis]|uniref:uncharacterized protein n=1 Tax=Candida jiufengensis TaxID=497108 RepID=UPI002224E63D|nr:uncharacterized protein KGF54_003091 [Candida jiufengensis]KAI5953719.1 hypothetical protein KGF54_003091 [Candida jiufengensis]
MSNATTPGNSIEEIKEVDVQSIKPNTDLTKVVSREIYLAEPNFENISLFRECLFIFFMCMSQLLTQAANSQTMVNAVVLGRAFDVSDKPGVVSWFSAAISLTVGTFILVSGRLGDLYGYKKLYIIGYIWFGVFSLICGFAGFTKSSVFFAIMRGLQGIGPAIMMPNSQALIGSFYPPSTRKNICFALFGATAPNGFIIGALFSAMFTETAWWPWTFWLCGIVSISAAILAYFVIPAHVGSKSSGKFDYGGAITGVTGLILINFAFNQGPNVGWDKVYVYVLLIVGFLFMGAFYFIEQKVEDPLVPPSVLNGDTGFILVIIAAGWSCFGIWLYYMFLWSLKVDGASPVIAAVQNITCGPVGVIAALSTAYMLRKIPSSIVLFIAMIFFLVGIIIMGLRPVHQIYWSQKFVSCLLMPFGMDISFPTGVLILQNHFPRNMQGLAGSLISTFVNYSISIGLGFAGTVEYYTTKDKVPGFDTTVYGYRRAYYMGMGLAGFGLVISSIYIFIQLQNRRKSLQQESRSLDMSDGDNEVIEAKELEN